MKIALIQNNLSPYRIPLFETLARMPDVDFTLLLMAPDKPSYPSWKFDAQDLPFRAIIVPGWRIVNSHLAQICINPGLLPLLRRETPDAIICCGFSLSTLFVVIHSLFAGTPIIIWMEGTEVTEGLRRTPGIRRVLRRWIARKASGFVLAGQLSREYIESLMPKGYKKPMRISYNCVDTEKLSGDCNAFRASGENWESFRRRFPAKNILFSGRLVELKGIREMIQVYQRVLQRCGERVGLIILGEGEMRQDIEELKRKEGLKDIFLEGFIGPDGYFKYFAVADVFILLSHTDCNPLVVFEALSCGLPLICTNKAGNAPDFVHDGVTGFIVNPEDIEGATEKVLTILNSLESIGGEKSRQMVQKANYRDSAKAFLEIAAEVIAQNGQHASNVSTPPVKR